jgi:tetratricopeptide (TPR) repeat protein
LRKLLFIFVLFPLFAVRAQTCDSATWHYVEGVKALHVRGDRAAAAASFERALSFDPNHTGALAAAAAAGAPDALEYARRALRTDTTDIYLRGQLVGLLLEANRLEEAVALDPDDLGVLIAQADSYRKRGDEARFLDIAERLMQHNSIDGASLFEDLTANRGLYGRNYLRMLGMARRLMLANPSDYRAVNLYAGALLAGGRAEEGVNIYKNYITDTTSFAAPYEMVVDGEAWLRRPDSVRLWGRRAIERLPADASLRLRLGAALAHLGLDKEALAVYNEARRRAPNDSIRSIAHALSGIIYATRDDARRSIAAYSRAIALDPANAIALNNLAYTLAVQGRRLEHALDMSERSLAAEPLNATYIDTYGYILYRLGRLEESLKVLRQAMSLADDPDIMLHYADVLEALGEEFMAEHYRKKAQETQ